MEVMCQVPGPSHSHPHERLFSQRRSDKIDCLHAIGEPARKHGVPDTDIWHGVRNATHKIDMDEDLTMLIGPARDGAPLEIGVLGLDSDDPVIIHALPLRAKFYRFLG